MSQKKVYVWSGALAGFLCGLLGGGGGAVLVPLLVGYGGLSPQKALAHSVGIMLVLCGVSTLLYGLRGDLSYQMAFPYLLGGGLGGVLGGRIFPNLKAVWLQRGFALLLLCSGLRGLLT